MVVMSEVLIRWNAARFVIILDHAYPQAGFSFHVHLFVALVGMLRGRVVASKPQTRKDRRRIRWNTLRIVLIGEQYRWPDIVRRKKWVNLGEILTTGRLPPQSTVGGVTWRIGSKSHSKGWR